MRAAGTGDPAPATAPGRPMAGPLAQEVAAIVGRIAKTPPERLAGDTDLRAALNIDSLQGLQIVAAVEKRFGIVVPSEEMDFYTTIDSIIATIERLRGAAPAPPSRG